MYTHKVLQLTCLHKRALVQTDHQTDHHQKSGGLGHDSSTRSLGQIQSVDVHGVASIAITHVAVGLVQTDPFVGHAAPLESGSSSQNKTAIVRLKQFATIYRISNSSRVIDMM